MPAAVDARETLLNIVRCPNVNRCLTDGVDNCPCATVVNLQKTAGPDAFQVPEPWSGHLETAPILFLSSNPSINEVEKYPTRNWLGARTIDFFENRFGEGKEAWVLNGNRALQEDGSYARGAPFWGAVRNRASELLDRRAIPGQDYALTEVVHCKSRDEKGVQEALHECMKRHLTPVLSISAARALIVLGKFAQEALRHTFPHMGIGELHGPIDIAGRLRMVVLLPHPSSFSKSKTLFKCLSSAELARLRTFVKGKN